MTAARDTDETACDVRCVDPDAIEAARRALSGQELQKTVRLFSALGDLTRLRLVTALLEGPLCTCDLAAVLEVSDSAVSHQLRQLKDLQLVVSQRDGRIVYHELAGEHVRRFVQGVCKRSREVSCA